MSASSYIRGAETVGHWFAMGKASVFRHLVVSLVFSLFFGALFLLALLEPPVSELQNYFSEYGTLVLHNTSPASQGTRFLTADSAILEHSVASKLGFRTPVFLLRQWLLLSVFAFCPCLIVFGVLFSRHGALIAQEKHRRGAEFRDLTKEHRRTLLRRASLLFSFGLLTGGVLFFWLKDAGDLALLLDGLHAAAMARSPSYLSWNSQGEGVWFWSVAGGSFQSLELGSTELVTALNEPLFMAVGRPIVFSLLFAFVPTAGYCWLMWEAPRGEGVVVADVEVPAGNECQHIVFCGGPGSGKSTQINLLLEQVRQRSEPAVVFDSKPEFLQLFGREGYDIVLNPFDARCANWDLWSEVESPSDYDSIAAAFVPVGEKDKYWSQTARSLFAAACRWCDWNDQRSIPELFAFLTQHPADIYAELIEHPETAAAAAHLDEDGESDRIKSVMSNLMVALEPLKFMQGVQGEPFSIRHFIKESRECDRWLFLAPTARTEAMLSPLLSLWVFLAVQAALDAESGKGRLWTVLDEFPALQRIKALESLMARGRSYGNAVVLGFQAISQVRAVYGPADGAALLSQPQTWVILKHGEEQAAKWASEQLGQTEVEEIKESQSMGANSQRDGVNLGSHSRQKLLVLPSEILELKAHEGFCRVAGVDGVHFHPASKVRFVEPTGVPGFVPRMKEEK